jgi:hypothetical protein
VSTLFRRRLALGWLSLLLLVGQAGCARHTVPLSQEVRAELGTVAVIPARFEAKTELRMPAKGGPAGTGRGAATGALKGMALAAEVGRGCQGIACGAFLALIPASGIIGALIGAIHGGVTAVPAVAVEDGLAELRSVVAEIDLQETLRDRVLRVAKAQTCHRLVIDIGDGPHEPKEQVGYQPLVADGIETVLEISVLDFELTGPWNVNPELELVMSVRARLVRTSDGALLYNGTLDYRSMKRRFTDWAVDGGSPFREEREGALDHLAGQIVAETLRIENGGSEACRG